MAQASRTINNGTTIGQFREGDKLIDIVLRQPLDERNAMTDLGNAYLHTATGQSIPLMQIAKPVFAWEPGVMWRENRDYAITVQGDIVEGLRRAEHDVAVDVVLVVLEGLVADAHGPHAAVAGEARHLALVEPALERDAVDRLQVAVGRLADDVAEVAQVVLHRLDVGQ